MFYWTLPLILISHENGSGHCDHHRDNENKNSHHLADTHLVVYFCHQTALELGGLAAPQLPVVIQKEAVDTGKFPEHPLEVTVTVPGVALQKDVQAGGVDAQERHEVQAGQPVGGQVKQSQAGEWGEHLRVGGIDVVPPQPQHLQRVQGGEKAQVQAHESVSVQAEPAQCRYAAQSSGPDHTDEIVAQVQLQETVHFAESSGLQDDDVIVGQDQLWERLQPEGEAVPQGNEAVPTQIQPLDARETDESSVSHRADVVLFQ